MLPKEVLGGLPWTNRLARRRLKQLRNERLSHLSCYTYAVRFHRTPATLAATIGLVVTLIAAGPVAADAVSRQQLAAPGSSGLTSGFSTFLVESNLKRTSDLTPELRWGYDSSWNRYSYVLNNPVKLVDPDGKAPRGALEEMSVRSHMSAPQVQNYNTEQAKVEAGYALQWAGVFAPFGPEDAVIGLAIRGGGRALRALGLLGKAAKRGPKPRGVGPHNLKIKEVGDSVTDGQVIAGGQRLPEVLIETQGGIKSGRRPDILVERPDGSSYGINVGKTSKSGAPIKREADAINDLEGAGVEMHYVQYD